MGWGRHIHFARGEQSEPSAVEKRAHWHVEEGVALLLGKDPVIITAETAKTLQEEVRVKFGRTTKFLKDYFHLTKEVDKAIVAKHLQLPIKPTSFITWATDRGLPVAAQLTNSKG